MPPQETSELQPRREGGIGCSEWLDAIVCGDCLEVMKQLPDDFAMFGFADPPYNCGIEYDGYNDKREDYQEWCAAWHKEMRRVCKRVIVTPGHNAMWMWRDIETPHATGAWLKPGNPAKWLLGWCCWEPYLFWSRGMPMMFGEDTITASIGTQSDTGNHPCPKPLKLLKKLILKATKPGETVLDPFAGSGTTLLAAKELDRRFLGIEQSEAYVKIIKRRLEQETMPLGV